MPHAHNAITFIQEIIYMMRDSQLCFRNSDAKSPEYEECEHDGPKSLQHMSGDTMKDDIEIYGG